MNIFYLWGDVKLEIIQREKVKRIFKDKPHFAVELQKCRKITKDGIIWEPNQDRVKNVVLKLAQGHAAFELGLPNLGGPTIINFIPFSYMSPSERNEFELAFRSTMWLARNRKPSFSASLRSTPLC